MKPYHGVLRVGRVARWQRWWSYAILGTCGLTGLVWFVLLDVVGLQPPALLGWWIGHGVTSFLALLVIGAALPVHVQAAWRHHRNRWLGAIALGVLAAAGVTALLLLYGAEPWHQMAHWAHVSIGVAALVAFPWHVVKGRRSVGRVQR